MAPKICYPLEEPMLNNNHHLPTWVVVADAAQAKIYQVCKFPKLKEVACYQHPESRLHNQELATSKPGRGFQRGGITRYSYQSEMEPKQLEADKFAAELAATLAKCKEDHDYERLYIMAGPAFLGMLRRHLDPQVRKSIVGELNKELCYNDISDIEHHLYEM
jgi:protein required for attachment to host cells